jgi:microcystin-dependent protein
MAPAIHRSAPCHVVIKPQAIKPEAINHPHLEHHYILTLTYIISIYLLAPSNAYE